MAGKLMTGRAFFVLTALADGPRHEYGILGEVAELRAATARVVRARLGRVPGQLADRRPETGQYITRAAGPSWAEGRPRFEILLLAGNQALQLQRILVPPS